MPYVKSCDTLSLSVYIYLYLKIIQKRCVCGWGWGGVEGAYTCIFIRDCSITRNVRQEKISPILPPALVGKIFLSMNFLSCVNDYIKDALLHWQKFIPPNISAIQG